MATFNENLGNFMTECRNNALEELKANPRYINWQEQRRKLRSILVEKVGPELVDEYMEVMGAVVGMELSKVMLCGASTYHAVIRRFDSTTSEYRDFEADFVG